MANDDVGCGCGCLIILVIILAATGILTINCGGLYFGPPTKQN